MSNIKCYRHSYIRRWLNGAAFDIAFNSDEKALILETPIEEFVWMPDEENQKKPKTFFRKKGESRTEAMKTQRLFFTDRMFLLSIGDIINEEFGFSKDEKACDESRVTGYTDYSEFMGVHVGDDGQVTWRLRTTAPNNFVRCVDGKGRASFFFSMDSFSYGIRPAITLDIKSGAFENLSKGDIIEFGYYPQTMVTNKEEISRLKKLQRIPQFDSSFSFEFGDVIVPGTFDSKYRSVCLNTYRNVWQEKAGIELNTDYWFKWEPVKWIILNPESGFAVCEKIIDAQTFGYVNSDNDIFCDVS